MSTQPVAQPTTTNKYYELNSRSSKWQEWSINQISCSTPCKIPVGLVGLVASIILRVVEGTFKLIANAFLTVKYCCCGTYQNSPPAILPQVNPRLPDSPYIPPRRENSAPPVLPTNPPGSGLLVPPPFVQIPPLFLPLANSSGNEAPRPPDPARNPQLPLINADADYDRDDPIRRCGANLPKNPIQHLREHKKTSIAAVGLAGVATAGVVAATGTLFWPATAGLAVTALAWKYLRQPSSEAAPA